MPFSYFLQIPEILTSCEFFGGRGLERIPPRDLHPLPPLQLAPLPYQCLVTLPLLIVARSAEALQVVHVEEALLSAYRPRQDVVCMLSRLDDSLLGALSAERMSCTP